MEHDPVWLENSQLRLLLAPQQGTGVLAFEARHRGEWLPLMPDARSPENSLRWASWLMLPYSNRIQDGAFSFEGEAHQLENGENHAIHGDVRQRPWQVLTSSAEEFTASFSSETAPGFNWPWDLEISAEYRLMENALTQAISVRNTDKRRMPVGGGFHPYFSRHITRRGEEVCLDFRFDRVYPDAWGTRIPSGPAEAPPPEWCLEGGRPLSGLPAFDFCTTGYDGGGSITWPETGLRAEFDCSPELDHLVLYNPVEQAHFAVEPVVNANDGVNLLARGDPTSGMRVLAPGESLSFSFTLRVISV